MTLEPSRSAPKADLLTWTGAAFSPAKGLPAEWIDNGTRLAWSSAITDLGFTPGVTAGVLIAGTTNNFGSFDRVMPFTVNFSDGVPIAGPEPISVAPTPAPKPIKRAALSGTARVGKRLTCSTGTWSGAPKLTYAWKRDGKTIKGEHQRRYTVRRSDRGKRLTCAVTGKNAGGTATVTTRPMRVKK